jgi:uncharacterized protein (DUF2344 family)
MMEKTNFKSGKSPNINGLSQKKEQYTFKMCNSEIVPFLMCKRHRNIQEATCQGGGLGAEKTKVSSPQMYYSTYLQVGFP